MVAFVPISPAAARQLLQGISDADAGEFLSAFVEAGRIRAYAEVVETLSADGGRTQVIDGRIPTSLWRRFVADGCLNQALTLASVRLPGDGLVGGRPAVNITGIRFNPDNVRKVASQHGPTAAAPPAAPVVPVPIVIAKRSVKAVAPKPPLIEIMETAPPPVLKPAKPSTPTKVRRGLPADAVTVTIKEACEILDVGRTKLNELTKTDLEVKRIGRSVKIKAESIRAFMGRD